MSSRGNTRAKKAATAAARSGKFQFLRAKEAGPLFRQDAASVAADLAYFLGRKRYHQRLGNLPPDPVAEGEAREAGTNTGTEPAPDCPGG